MVDEIEPDIVVMENVLGVRVVDGYETLFSVLDEHGYYVNDPENRRVECPDYGIPQRRKRWITLASREGPIELDPPADVEIDREPTVREWTGDLKPLEAGKRDEEEPLHAARDLLKKNLERIRISDSGGDWRDWEAASLDHLLADCHKRDNGRSYTAPYSRMRPDEPAPTITTQFYNYGSGRFGHYDTDQDRALSLLEGALLQTFPEGYEFCDEWADAGATNVGRLIGNAVPPKLGEHVGEAIRTRVGHDDAEVSASPTD